MTKSPAAAPHLTDLARPRRVGDRIDRELGRRVVQDYRRQAAGATAGMPACVPKQVTRPVRNREPRVASLA